jgi:hypothetical protein
MKFYPEDFNVEVIVPFTDLNGAAVTPSAVNAVLYDTDDEVIVDFGSLPFDTGDTSKSVMVAKAFNILEDGELRAGRILRIELVTAAGTIPRSFSYVIESEQRLQLMTNTFLTFEGAEILAIDIPNVTGWTTASEDQKKAALVEAYRRLTAIPMKYLLAPLDTFGWNTLSPRDIETEQVITRSMWGELTADDYAEFPTHFKKVLRRAQILEANELLQGDTVLKKHRAGIVSETIGESSVTLRDGKVDYGISSQAMSALAGYIYFNARIARA